MMINQDQAVNTLKSNLRISLQEYSERIKELDDIKSKIDIGGVEPDDIRNLCERSMQALLNSQIVVLDRVYPKLDIFHAKCPKCKSDIYLMCFGQGKAWSCGKCGTASTRNYRMPEVIGEAIPRENCPDIAEQIVLALQRKKPVK